MLVFFWSKEGKKTVQKVKNYGGSKLLSCYYGFDRRTIFSTAGSFGNRKNVRRYLRRSYFKPQIAY